MKGREVARATAQEELNQFVESKAGLMHCCRESGADPALRLPLQKSRNGSWGSRTRLKKPAERLKKPAKEIGDDGGLSGAEAVMATCSQTCASEVEIGALLAAAAPEEGSLLRFLREHRPGWTRDIARVIAPGLLQRTDLAPSVSDAESSIFGVTMDLSN